MKTILILITVAMVTMSQSEASWSGSSSGSRSGRGFRSSDWSQRRAHQNSFRPWQARQAIYRGHRRQQQARFARRDYSNSGSSSSGYIRARPNPFYQHNVLPQPVFNRNPVPIFNVAPTNHHHNVPLQPDYVHHQTVFNPNPVPIVHIAPINPIPEPMLPIIYQGIPIPNFSAGVDPEPLIEIKNKPIEVFVQPDPVSHNSPTPIYTLEKELTIHVDPTDNQPTPLIIGKAPPKHPPPVVYNDVDPVSPVVVVPQADAPPVLYNDVDPVSPVVVVPTADAPPVLYNDIDPPTVIIRNSSEQPNRGDFPSSPRGSTGNLGPNLSGVNSVGKPVYLVGQDPSINIPTYPINPDYNENLAPRESVTKPDTKLDEQILADVFGSVINSVVNSKPKTTPSQDVDTFIKSIFSYGNPFATSSRAASIDFGGNNSVRGKLTRNPVATIFSPAVQAEPIQPHPPLGTHGNPFFTG